tara:strand:+ start:126 stop:899 length:774 start_codon:yes stop_codon:yes gene_type:complete
MRNNKKNLVSVIMPFFKKEKYFKKAYESAINQTYKNLEIIIICDDTNFKSIKFLEKFKKKKYKTIILYNKKNLGVSLSRNKGIKKSKGKYIAFLDCDDEWKKEKIETQLKWMLKNNLNFSHTSYDIIDENGIKIGKQIAKRILDYKELLRCCYIGTSSVIVEKKLIEKNLFKKISTQEDYITWLNISKKMDLRGLNLTLSSWRLSKNALSRNLFNKISNAFSVYNKYQKKNIIESFYRVVVLIFFNLIKKIQNRTNV